jgi:hypothetical protein
VNKEEFLLWAENNNVPEGAFYLDGGHPSEAFVVDSRGLYWVVYYSERGIETDLRQFVSEEDALDHLLLRVKQTIKAK